MHAILKDKRLLISLGGGLLVRLYLSIIPGFKIDVDAWFAWAHRLSSEGFIGFYSENIWTNYTPGYLYILKILGDFQNLFSINTEAFYLLLKLPPITSDLILSVFIYKIISESRFAKMSLVGSLLILFNPALIFNSAVWGQIDSILSLFMVISIYYLNKNQLALSSVLIGLAFLIKPQAIALAPVFLLFLFKNFSIKNFLQICLPGLLITIILSIPFFGIQSIQKLFELFLKMTGDYPYTSLFAYNFWGGVGFWIKDNQIWASLSFQHWGYLFYFSFWIGVAMWHLFKKNLSLYSLAILATLSFYFLPTRVHERYLYPAIPFLIIILCQFKSNILSLATYYLCLIYFLNLYYVYIYYNHHFLKMESLIYSPYIYDFLTNYSKQISMLSTFVFVFITIFVIKLNHDKKISSA